MPAKSAPFSASGSRRGQDSISAFKPLAREAGEGEGLSRSRRSSDPPHPNPLPPSEWVEREIFLKAPLALSVGEGLVKRTGLFPPNSSSAWDCPARALRRDPGASAAAD